MGALANELKSELERIFREVGNDVTPEEKARQIAEAIENAILHHLVVEIPPGSVIVVATGGSPNPAPIRANVRAE